MCVCGGGLVSQKWIAKQDGGKCTCRARPRWEEGGERLRDGKCREMKVSAGKKERKRVKVRVKEMRKNGG